MKSTEIAQLHDKVADFREQNAELRAAHSERRRSRPLVVASLLLSPILFSISVDLYKSGHDGVAFALLLISLVFLGLGIRGELFHSGGHPK